MEMSKGRRSPKPNGMDEGYISACGVDVKRQGGRRIGLKGRQ
jgi:hypothetical protein